MAKATDFPNLLNHVSDSTYNFVMSQVRNQRLKPQARRFTLEQKVMALAVMKISGKGYRLLSKLFALPSRKTLTHLLSKLPFRAGIINNKILSSLRLAVQKMNTQERSCVLLFDEMSIEAHLQYNEKENCIDGFEEHGCRRKAAFANYVNIFILQGACKQWKQPLMFTFNSGPINGLALKILIKTAIEKCQGVGLNIVATVCDQGLANQKAILLLKENVVHKSQRGGEQDNGKSFTVGEKSIVPLFDVPHLFKGLRNNLLNKNLHFELKGRKYVAKWQHVQEFYELDIADDTRMPTKLTDAHVYPEKINKMKVSLCTQVFSNSVGSLMWRLSKWNGIIV